MWLPYLNGFKAYLRLERGLSPNTVAAYMSDMEKFAAFAERECGVKSPEKMGAGDIRQYMGHLAGEGVKERSQARALSSIKAFYRYLEDEVRDLENPTDGIAGPKLGRYLPEVLNTDEIQRMLDVIDRSKPEGERNRAMLEVLFACGLRVSELISLQFSDLMLEREIIRVIGKGDKQRLVPIGSSAIHHLNIYIDHVRKPQVAARGFDSYVFLNQRGRKLSRQSVFLLVKELAERAGIRKHISPHTFRHSFATALVEADAGLRAVQEMLGHESITTTEIYTHISRKKLRETLIKHHPRSKRGRR